MADGDRSNQGRRSLTAAALPHDLAAFVGALKDRHDIEQCLLRYTRGVDRFDYDLMRSAYHDDAWDQHGVASGDPDDFCRWAIGFHGKAQHSHHHMISNVTIDLVGDIAHVESYYLFVGDNRSGAPTLSYGRYVDRFERRGGDWRIAHRVCLIEYSGYFNETRVPDDVRARIALGPPSRDRSDPSYRRPLGRLPEPAA